jgi:hypothetical protein
MISWTERDDIDDAILRSILQYWAYLPEARQCPSRSALLPHVILGALTFQLVFLVDIE